MHDQFWVELGALIVSTLGIIITGIWKLTEVKADLRKDIIGGKEEVEEMILTLRKEVGETVLALREKVTQVELYIRDNYVTKETFNTVLDRILLEIRSITDKMETNRITLENKVDDLRRGQIQQQQQQVQKPTRGHD